MTTNDFTQQIIKIVGAKQLLTNPQQTKIYRQGFRFGYGEAIAVVLPQTLLQLWQVAQLCAQQKKIIIMQAANTGLTGGSTPAGNDYDREVVIISVNALKGVHLINGGQEVLAFPGSSLTELELALKPIKREPHSVIGSSCIGASVIGGVCNNSGGSLIRRGPAYTEMALFGRINQDGQLELVNNLGIELGQTAEEIFKNLERQQYIVEPTSSAEKRTWADDYATKIRDVDADTPARYNADPSYWHDSSGCSGKLIVFAVRLSSFAAIEQAKVFYIGTNDEQLLIKLRRALLTQLEQLPIAAEYMDRQCFDLTYRFGKSVYLALHWFGAQFVPSFNRFKNKIDRFFQCLPLVPNNFGDKIIDFICCCLPCHLPKRIMHYRDKYQHYLMLKIEHNQQQQVQQLLEQTLVDADGDFFLCDDKEGKAAFMQRFAAGGGPGLYCSIKGKKNALLSLDLSLRRNDPQWSLQLPGHLKQQLELEAICGHFLCYVIHQYYILKDGVDKNEFKQQVLQYLDSRQARYPAEHNVGHLYHGEPQHLEFFKQLDPTNSLNPGIGLASKKQNWQ